MRIENCSCGSLFNVATFLVKACLIFFSLPSVSAGQQPLLQITSPTNGATVNPGQNLSVSVSSPAGAAFAQVDVIGESPIGMSTVATSVPAQFSIAIPSDIASGQYRLTAEGTTSSGQDARSASITIDVERPDLPNSLTALLSGIFFQSQSQTTPLIIMATFSDGSVLDVSRSPYLTYTSSNTSVATVDAKGVVAAVAVGTGFVTARYTLGGNSVQISLPVNFPQSGGGTGTTNFFISTTPGTQTIAAGTSASFTVSATSFNGFTGAISLSLGGLPNGATASFSPTSVNVSGTSTLTVSTVQSTPQGTYVLTITGTSGSLNPGVSALLIVGASGSTPTPAITSLSPTSGSVGTSVTITGTNFGATQGTSTATFNGTAATPTSWSTTSIVTPVPTGATTGNVVVTVGGAASNGVSFTVSSGGDGPVTYVQGNSAGQPTVQTTATVTYTAAQASGNLNVVVVGWWESPSVQSVTDTRGNTYALAVGPTTQVYCQSKTNPGITQTQAIYYAKNIGSAAAGGNTVTVTFNGPLGSATVLIAEYSGLDTANPIDVSVANFSSTPGTTASSGSVTTTNAHDVLVGADLSDVGTAAPGTGYTSRILNTDILEDQIVAATGSYSATATLNLPTSSCNGALNQAYYVMQMVAFRAATH